MTSREGNPKVRIPDDLIAWADWLAAEQTRTEKERGNRRGVSLGRALVLILASHGYLPQPKAEKDLRRMREIRSLADRRQEARQ